MKVPTALISGGIIFAIYGFVSSFFGDKTDYQHIEILLLIIAMGLLIQYIINNYSKIFFPKNKQVEQIPLAELTESKSKKESRRIKKSLELEILAHIEAESHLRESEEKYKNLIRSMPEGIFIVQNNKIVFVNPKAQQMTGFDEDELIGKKFDSLFIMGDPDQNSPGQDLPDQDLNGEFKKESCEYIMSKNKQKIYIEKNDVEIKFNLSSALLFSVRDVTEKVMAQKDSQRLQKELEKARKMEAFGIMAGGVAHDLNNVLAGLVSIPDLLIHDLPEDSDLIDHVEMIKDSGKRASIIADELLTMARCSSRSFAPVQINNIIEDYLISFEYESLRKQFNSAEITLDLDPKLPLIHASHIHVRKIVMNLVSNAVESIGKSTGKILVKTDTVEFHNQRINGYPKIKNGKYVKFVIMDTGTGISKEDINHIFEPFYSKKVLGRSGTGLGLSVVWTAIHDHNGYIHVCSQHDRTFFTLYFPISVFDMKETDETMILTLSDYSGNNEKVLIVDDLANQRRIGTNLLKRLGYTVFSAESGEAAVIFIKEQLLKEERVDIVVLDMVMKPGMNGLETYQELLLIDPEIKTIITSGYSESEDVRKAQALGAGEYIKKPYSLQKIGMSIKKELSK